MFVKNEKGITLISLVVTIVIMLVLAGVSIRYFINTSLIDRTINLNDKNMISSLVDEWNDRRAFIEIKGSIPATEMNYDNLKNIDLYLTEAYVNPDNETRYSEKLIQNTVLNDEYNNVIVIVDGKIRYIKGQATPQQEAVFKDLGIEAFDDDGSRWFSSVIDISGKTAAEDIGLHHHNIGDEEEQTTENTVTNTLPIHIDPSAVTRFVPFDKIVASKFEYKDTSGSGLLLDIDPQETENMKMTFSLSSDKLNGITTDMFIRIFPTVKVSQNLSDLKDISTAKIYAPANKNLRVTISNYSGLTYSNPNGLSAKILFFTKTGDQIGEADLAALNLHDGKDSFEYTTSFTQDVYGMVIKIPSLTKINGRVDLSISYEQ